MDNLNLSPKQWNTFPCRYCNTVIFMMFLSRQTKPALEIDMQNMIQTKPASMVMTVQQAAEYLGLAVSTLNKWRCHGGGPVFIKMGRSVRYRVEDLEAFVRGNRMSSSSAY